MNEYEIKQLVDNVVSAVRYAVPGAVSNWVEDSLVVSIHYPTERTALVLYAMRDFIRALVEPSGEWVIHSETFAMVNGRPEDENDVEPEDADSLYFMIYRKEK